MSHQLETIIGYQFKNPKLLETALTHTSYANESRTPVQHNERLEFLGDSVLQIVSADYLFHAYADRPEGDLTRIRSSLVSEGALFQFAQEINLGEYLRLGRKLTRPEHYEALKGEKIGVKLIRPTADGVREFAGILKGREGSTVTVETENGPVSFEVNAASGVHLCDDEHLFD